MTKKNGTFIKNPEEEKWLVEMAGTLLLAENKSGWVATLAREWVKKTKEEVMDSFSELYNSGSIKWDEEVYFPVWVAKGTTAKFDFGDSPHGTPIDCEVTAGAGEVTFYESKKKIASYNLTLEPGGTFYVRLNTDPDKKDQKWEVRIKGTDLGEKVVSIVDGEKIESKYPVNQFKFTMVGLKYVS